VEVVTPFVESLVLAFLTASTGGLIAWMLFIARFAKGIQYQENRELQQRINQQEQRT